MITAGILLLALAAVLYAVDWPKIYGGVPYTEPRHVLYEWILFAGKVALILGVALR